LWEDPPVSATANLRTYAAGLRRVVGRRLVARDGAYLLSAEPGESDIERFTTLVAQARNANPNLRETDALDALELGARRMDLIGMKFQLADEMATNYAKAYALQNSKVKEDHEDVSRFLGDINNGANGKLQDMRNNYSLMRDLYEAAWLKSYRPYFLRNNLEHYDSTIQMWLQRIDRVRTVQRQWVSTQTIPPAAELGIPAPPLAVIH